MSEYFVHIYVEHNTQHTTTHISLLSLSLCVYICNINNFILFFFLFLFFFFSFPYICRFRFIMCVCVCVCVSLFYFFIHNHFCDFISRLARRIIKEKTQIVSIINFSTHLLFYLIRSKNKLILVFSFT